MYGLNFAPPSAISANNPENRRRPLCRFGGVHSTDTSAKYAEKTADETAEDIAGGRAVVVEAEWLGLDHVSHHGVVITHPDGIMDVVHTLQVRCAAPPRRHTGAMLVSVSNDGGETYGYSSSSIWYTDPQQVRTFICVYIHAPGLPAPLQLLSTPTHFRCPSSRQFLRDSSHCARGRAVPRGIGRWRWRAPTSSRQARTQQQQRAEYSSGGDEKSR